MRSKARLTALCAALLALSAMAQAQLVPDAVQSALERQAGQAQERAAERAQERAAERAQEQAQQQTSEQVVERAVERAQEQAADRAQQQAAERTRGQAIDRVQNQTIDRVQGQAQAAQNQALERVRGGQAERVQEQLLERSQQQLERSQQQLERTQERLGNAAGEVTGPGRGRGNGVANGQDLPAAAQQAILQLPPQARGRIAGPSPMAQLPERLPIVGDDGDEVFVEIAIEPNVRVLEREWVMLLSEAQREQLIDEAPDLMSYLAQTSTLEALDSYLLRFRVPPDLDADDQILDLVPEPLRELIDRNHIYSAQSGAAQDISGGNSGDSPEAGQGEPDSNRLTVPMSAVCEDPVAVGVIDSLINTEHPAFARAAGAAPAFVSRQFLQEQVDRVSGHGTAVAGVLVGDGSAYGNDLAPLLPNATIYSASVVYSQDAYHQGATVMHLLEALSWMLEQEQLQVINMSLTGPANRLLEQAIGAVQAQGKLVVAAAGNQGPHADLLYPAAYDGVVTATAVADDHTVYRWAAQGDHVDFAALGVSVPTARGSGDFGRESGTSMAAPVVSAFFACELASTAQTADQARQALVARATDLGGTGHDPVYGHGLLHPD